tara:strand:+ start:518 stop:1666 length:1149 start_codon:yes stop_codon:yes gene_type:complete
MDSKVLEQIGIISGISILIIVLITSLLTVYIMHSIQQTEKYKAYNRLCNLEEDVQRDYMESYDKVFNDQSMISTLDDYTNKRKPARFVIKGKVVPSKYTADCYSVLHDLCALGDVKKMYIPKEIDSLKTLQQNQDLWEEEVSKTLNVRSGGKLLEIGCGCGRIAHHMSQLTQCQVYGINIDETQLKDARQYAFKHKTNNQFLFKDLNKPLPFQDNEFDAIYEFGAFTSFIKNYKKVFNELFRVLKPGGILYISDAVLLDNFDRSNPAHLELLVNARQVMAGGVFLHYKYFEDFGKKAGFSLLSSKGGEFPDVAHDLPVLKKTHEHFNNIENLIYILSKCNVIPSHFNALIKRLRKGGDDLITMEDDMLLTTGWEYYFKKPES